MLKKVEKKKKMKTNKIKFKEKIKQVMLRHTID
jgi:hypothetical protein